jgi:hypothetical protein
VIFVAECCGFDGRGAQLVHDARRHAARGKMAAAGDDTGSLLPMEGGR